MSKKINIEIDESYKEKIDILKKVFVGEDGKPLEHDGELLQGLMDTFLEYIQNHHAESGEGEGGHVHGPDCNH